MSPYRRRFFTLRSRRQRLINSLAHRLHRLLEEQDRGDEFSVTELASFYNTCQIVALTLCKGNESKAEQFMFAVEAEAWWLS